MREFGACRNVCTFQLEYHNKRITKKRIRIFSRFLSTSCKITDEMFSLEFFTKTFSHVYNLAPRSRSPRVSFTEMLCYARALTLVTLKADALHALHAASVSYWITCCTLLDIIAFFMDRSKRNTLRKVCILSVSE